MFIKQTPSYKNAFSVLAVYPLLPKTDQAQGNWASPTHKPCGCLQGRIFGLALRHAFHLGEAPCLPTTTFPPTPPPPAPCPSALSENPPSTTTYTIVWTSSLGQLSTSRVVHGCWCLCHGRLHLYSISSPPVGGTPPPSVVIIIRRGFGMMLY